MTAAHPKLQSLVMVGRRLVLWLVFVGLIAVASTLVTILIGYLTGSVPTLQELLADGDGFLIAIAISADAIGRATARRSPIGINVLLAGLVMIVALLAFGITKTRALEHRAAIEAALAVDRGVSPERRLTELTRAIEQPPSDERKVMRVSSVIILASVMTALMVVIAEKGNDR